MEGAEETEGIDENLAYRRKSKTLTRFYRRVVDASQHYMNCI